MTGYKEEVWKNSRVVRGTYFSRGLEQMKVAGERLFIVQIWEKDCTVERKM